MNDSRKNLAIQSLKGIAAIVVFLSHTLGMLPFSLIEKLNHSVLHLFFDGQCSVIIFFVISGFFYYHKSISSISVYIITVMKKAVRIYPSYIVVMFIAFILCNLHMKYNSTNFSSWSNSFWESNISILELLKQCSLVFPIKTDLINPPVWYLRVEVFMFLFMPLIVSFIHRYGWLLAVPFVILSTCLQTMPFCLIYCGYYLIGTLICYLSKFEQVIELFSHKICRIILFIMALLLLNINNEIGFSFFYGIEQSWMKMLQCIGAGVLIMIILFSNNSILRCRFLVFMGDISYEFYLCHFVILLALKPFFFHWAFFVLIAFLLTLISSVILNKYVDQKCVSIFNRFIVKLEK